MTYGSATTAEFIQPYFEHIYKGRALPAPEVIAEYARRYRVVGRSPLIEHTEAQAQALQKHLAEHYVVRAGMRHSAPFIADAVAACAAAGVSEVVGIILAPQQSAFIREGYEKDLREAAEAHQLPWRLAAAWPTEPHFIEFLAQEIKKAPNMPVVFTTHSLPKRVVEQEPHYMQQMRATEAALAAQLPGVEHYSAYQSAGHTPEEWLTPDLSEIIAKLKARGHREVLIVPTQFVADHLELLYDLDIATRQQCEELGLAYHRTEAPNSHPLFVEALAAVAHTIE